MPRLHIVTDSSAAAGTLLANPELSVTVVQSDSRARNSSPPEAGLAERSASILPPRPEDYAQTFLEASRDHSGILCITPSCHISGHWEQAQAGARLAAGACPIRVFDSQTFSAAQALLTLRAHALIQQPTTLDILENSLRSLLTHSYTMLYVENVEQLSRAGILSPQHTFFSAMLGVKPLVAVEGGRLLAVEKARTRAQAIERLFEFAAEFGQHAHIVIQHDHLSADTAHRMHERMISELEGHFDIFVYNPSLATLVGKGAIVVAILENVTE